MSYWLEFNYTHTRARAHAHTHTHVYTHALTYTHTNNKYNFKKYIDLRALWYLRFLQFKICSDDRKAIVCVVRILILFFNFNAF